MGLPRRSLNLFNEKSKKTRPSELGITSKISWRLGRDLGIYSLQIDIGNKFNAAEYTISFSECLSNISRNAKSHALDGLLVLAMYVYPLPLPQIF